MNIVLPVDYQTLNPKVDGLGTADARSQNSNRNAVEPAQQNAKTKQNSQDGATKHDQHQQGRALNKPHQDIVTISAEGKQASQKDAGNTLNEEEKGKVQALKDRDREVRVHEQAHSAVGGQYASSPSYQYETGPDGKRYAIAGEVSIDVSEEQKPEDTIQKMQIVRAAALAPAEPSAQDLKVAADASQKENQARAEVGRAQLSSGSNEAAQASESMNTKLQVYEEQGAYENKSVFSISA